MKTVLGPAKDPLALGICYEAGSKCPVQIRHWKLFATKIYDQILEAFPTGFCCSLNKREIDQTIS